MNRSRASVWQRWYGLVLLLGAAAVGSAQAEIDPHGGMLRYPDVSATQIVFSYANDLWIVARDGGQAVPLASPEGVEMFPRFSPDGRTIAFMGNYDGDIDLYTIPVDGGIPHRVTHHPASELLNGWTPDGRLLFSARGITDQERPEIFAVEPEGGMPEKLPVPYGGNAVISPDGAWLAYTPYVRDFRTWKRYRGGRASDVWLFNLNTHESRKITDWEGTDTIPMWHDHFIYYLSDAGPAARLNIWSYDVNTGQRAQVTHFKKYDVRWPSLGPGVDGGGEIIFQNGSELYLLNLKTRESRPVNVTIPGDRPRLRPQRVDVTGYIQQVAVSPNAKRAVLEARGDIWTAPAKEGVPRNLTRSSGVAERDPAWSPDGQWIAYLSDADGEYDLYVKQSDGKGETRKVVALGPGYRYMGEWSPDSKYIMFVERSGVLRICEVEGGKLTTVDTDPAGNLPQASWSHDSKWIAYTRTCDNDQSAVWLYEVANDARHQVTSGFFYDTWPTFDRKGEWLYFASHRAFESPIYEDIGASFVYTDTDVLCAVPLNADVKYPWPVKDDEETWKGKDEEKDKGEDKKPADKEEPPAEGETATTQPAVAVQDDGVSGAWTGLLEGGDALPPEGVPFTLTIALDVDNKLSGTLDGSPYAGTIVNGTYEPEMHKLRFALEIHSAEEVSTVRVIATIANGTMSGDVIGPDTAATFTATRKPAEEAAAAPATQPAEDDAAPAAENAETQPADGEKKDEKADEKKDEGLKIDFDGFEARAMQLPVSRGGFARLVVNDKDQLIYVRQGGHGSNGIKLFDIHDEEPGEKSVLDGVGGFSATPDGKKLLVFRGSALAIIDARPGQKFDGRVQLGGMVTVVDPRAEWEELFVDAWRRYRDYFYVANMHGVDWPGVRAQYQKMLADCVSRDDVAYVIQEMMSELNVGHAYYWSGAAESGPNVSVGLLGVDFELANGAYRIKHIHEGGAWDVDARNPLRDADSKLKEGDYLLAVNDIPLDTTQDPWAPFVGLVNRTTKLTISTQPQIDDEAREVFVKPLGSEDNLRYRSWVEQKRKYVAEKTDGQVGYLHVPDTGVNGQNNLFRQFYGQRAKAGLIVDERWNHGGQIPSRFIELLNRPLLNYWKIRDGRPGTTPPDAHFGPKCMLINESAGSGGDMFPALFRQVGLGKLIGMRTWGGLVGISGVPRLIDGTVVTVPNFGYYEKDGTWGIEGHGVDPDIVVVDDPAKMVDGGDPQLDAAIEYMLEQVKEHPYIPTPPPASPVRTGVGVLEQDH